MTAKEPGGVAASGLPLWCQHPRCGLRFGHTEEHMPPEAVSLLMEKGTEHPEEFQPYSVRIPAAIEKAEETWLGRSKDQTLASIR